jgi:hypothetical protein
MEAHQVFKIIQVKLCGINLSHKAMLQLGVAHHGASLQLELPHLSIYPLLVSAVHLLLATKTMDLNMCGIKLTRRLFLQQEHRGDNPRLIYHPLEHFNLPMSMEDLLRPGSDCLQTPI